MLVSAARRGAYVELDTVGAPFQPQAELIEAVARLFKPGISGNSIFENYVSRKQKSIEVKKKLIKLHTKINDYFTTKSGIAPSEIFFDINQFMEADLNYLLYKDWNEFLSFYDNLSRIASVRVPIRDLERDMPANRQKFPAVFAMGDKISPRLARTRPVEWLEQGVTILVCTPA